MDDKSLKFNEFLKQVDILNKDYFLSTKEKSITECFFTVNYVKLRYKGNSKLREDIKQSVIEKHKEIYGNEAEFDVIP